MLDVLFYFLEYNAFEVVNWADHKNCQITCLLNKKSIEKKHKKGGATELLMMEAMNIEGSCYEDDEDGNSRERERESRKIKKN